MKITHSISTDMLKRMKDSEINVMVRVIETLKAKGIPVIGSVSIIGVASGTLTLRTVEDIIEGDEWVYTWEGNPVKVATPELEEEEL